jgi:hypothetical protein
VQHICIKERKKKRRKTTGGGTIPMASITREKDGRKITHTEAAGHRSILQNANAKHAICAGKPSYKQHQRSLPSKPIKRAHKQKESKG